MKRIKRILQWAAGIIVGTYLTVMLSVNIPIVQQWLASGAAAALENLFGTHVSVGRVAIKWNGRFIVTDLTIEDRQGEEMLQVARVATNIGLHDIFHQRIRIGNTQLFGLHANLYQECEGCDPNFKFFIDAFASKDTTSHTPLDLQISQILVRRGHVRWEQRWKKGRPRSSFELTDFNITAQLNSLTDDSLNLKVKRFDLKERSGLAIQSLKFNLVRNKQGGVLSDFRLEMPNSSVEIPRLSVVSPDLNIRKASYHGTLNAHLSPTDFSTWLPKLTKIKETAHLSVHFQGDGDMLTVKSLHVQDDRKQVHLSASGQVSHLWQGKDSIRASIGIHDLHTESSLLQSYVRNAIVERLGNISLRGTADWKQQTLNTSFDLHTALGSAKVKGNLSTQGSVNATVQSSGFRLGELLKHSALGSVSLDVQAKGNIGKQPNLTLTGRIPEINYKGYRYRNLELRKLNYQASVIDGELSSGDPNAAFSAEGKVDFAHHTYKVKADVTRFSPHTLNLTKRYAHTDFSGMLSADLRGTQPYKMEGSVQLNGFTMTDTVDTYRPGDIHFTSRLKDNKQHFLLISPFLEAQVEGDINPKIIADQIKRMMSNYLPASPAPSPKKERTEFTPLQKNHEKAISFTLRAYNAEPLRRLADIPLTLSGPTTAYGEINSEQNALWINLSSPGIRYDEEQLRHIDLHIESNYESMLGNLSMQRLMKGRWLNVGLDTEGYDGKLKTRFLFSNDVEGEEAPNSIYAGDISIISRLWKDPKGKQGFEGTILPSNFIISDTLWSIHPGFVTYYNDALQIDSFCVSQGNRHIRIEGRASKSETDTLHAHLQDINLAYIFSLINFHAVELTGEATGDAYAHSLFSSPKADAYIRIPRFALNYSTMGNLDIHLNWGDRPYSIFLDGDITDNENSDLTNRPPGRTLVSGYITPKKDIDYHGLDLNINAGRVNLGFINKWTDAIFDRLQGHATGRVRIFGPFKQINIEGDALVNEASVGIPFIGVRYHLENDSVLLRPDNIYFNNATIYDPQGHHASVTGYLHHDSFKDLSYDISIHGENILGYNFTDFGDQNFYGTVYATGDISVKGHPGEVRIGIKARPERGTTFTYNATSPDKLTDTPFITYKPKNEFTNTTYNPFLAASNKPNDGTGSEIADADISDSESEESTSDLYLDFDLDINEQSTMNLLMDARSGDKIALTGNGRMLAHYYNKGSFNLFGTYRVSQGTYNLSLQEVIRKNFEFSPDGTVTFNGEPYDADLNLQAVHTVSGVSLNDINPKANFSNTTTRVNCLMNIGGKARAPRITFDFDIPNANEEEKQMVRSLISTEEERNMQVIYLLGIGRFYAYDYSSETQSQGTLAMNSLLSSTLSGTINQALTNMIGLPNWNFGANLRTGDEGWSNMDVEGMLQGNLLNNRLLLNGNFGYRDNPVATSNFVGDFDVKYLLTPSGTIALKAYSETNDRYFTKSSLTTQGIGVLLKKDFTSWRDLVVRKKHKAAFPK